MIGNSAAFLSAKAAYISCAQAAADASLSGRTAQIAQLHSTGSSVNSGEKPAGFYEELTQKTELEFAKPSSVFFKKGDFLRGFFNNSFLRQLSVCFRLIKRISIGPIVNGRFQI